MIVTGVLLAAVVQGVPIVDPPPGRLAPAAPCVRHAQCWSGRCLGPRRHRHCAGPAVLPGRAACYHDADCASGVCARSARTDMPGGLRCRPMPGE